MKNTRKVLCRVLFLSALLLSLFGFTVSSQAAVKLNKTKLSLNIGKNYTLRVKCSSGKVTWKTSAKKIATVKNGKVTAKKAGTATISAKVGKKTLKCKVTVPPAYKINKKAVKTYSLNLNHGQSKDLKITYTVNSPLCWKSNNASAVKCKWSDKWKKGTTTLTVSAIGYGNCVITLYNNYSKDTVEIKVHVNTPFDNCEVVIPADTLGDQNAPENRMEILETEFYNYLAEKNEFSMRVTMKLAAQGNADRANWGSKVDFYDADNNHLGEGDVYAKDISLGQTSTWNISHIPGNTQKIAFRKNPVPEAPTESQGEKAAEQAGE